MPFTVNADYSIGIAAFGLQAITTTCYTYAIDCHHEQSSDIAQLFNFPRQTFGFHLQSTFLLLAKLGRVVAFIPILGLYMEGTTLEGAEERYR